MNQIQARIQFLQWVQDSFPALSAAVIEYADTPGSSGLGAEQSWWQKAAGGFMALGTTYLALKNQREALKINLERAKSGLAPIDIAATAPVIRTQVEIDPALAAKIGSGIGGGMNQMMLIGGAVLLLFLFMKK